MSDSKHFIAWDDHLVQGVPFMDADHNHMVDLINAVYAAYDRHQWDRSVRDAMFNLSLFTVQHFNREEELMRSIGYPGFRAHAKAHQKLVEILDAVSIRIDRDGPAGIDDSLIDFLHKWLVKHILKSDRKLALFCTHHLPSS